jgi:hypothetical protein
LLERKQTPVKQFWILDLQFWIESDHKITGLVLVIFKRRVFWICFTHSLAKLRVSQSAAYVPKNFLIQNPKSKI